MKDLIIVLVLVFSAFSSSAQQKKYIKKAERATAKVQYAKALAYYDQALELDKTSYRANAGKGLLLGDLMSRPEEAIPYLERALEYCPGDTLSEIFHVLGKSYHFIGEYTKALYYYNKLKGYGEVDNDRFQDVLLKRMSDCHYALQHPPDDGPARIVLRNLGPNVNSPDAEYAPVITPQGALIFTSKRKDDVKEKINKVDGKYFESMYIASGQRDQFSSPRRYTRPDHLQRSRFSKYNESGISVSPDGQSLFIYKGGDLFETKLNDTLQKPDKMSDKINFSRYQSHASVSLDGRVLYFTSESAKGMGGTDLYRSFKNANGEWSEAELLDSTINTAFDEDSPYLAEDGSLYFASNGHPGYGGYDLYRTREQNGKWQQPENLGLPINSPGTDIFLSFTGKDRGYLSSARPGGNGDMDIYYISDGAGLEPDKPLDPLVASQMAEPKEPDPVAEPSSATTATASPYMSGAELEKLSWDPSMLYFDYSEYMLTDEARRILDHNISIMKQNQELQLIIDGHSDSKGTAPFNQGLSLKRATQVKEYLVRNGISPSRIKKTEGFGETRLKNNCTDEITCDEASHRQNRRVEIQILRPK